MQAMTPLPTVTSMERPFRGSRPLIFAVLMKFAQRTRFRIEVNGAPRMRAQCCGRACPADPRLQHGLHGCAFVATRHAAKQFVPGKQCGYRKCNGPSGNVM